MTKPSYAPISALIIDLPLPYRLFVPSPLPFSSPAHPILDSSRTRRTHERLLVVPHGDAHHLASLLLAPFGDEAAREPAVNMATRQVGGVHDGAHWQRACERGGLLLLVSGSLRINDALLFRWVVTRHSGYLSDYVAVPGCCSWPVRSGRECCVFGSRSLAV